ncbi:MAG: hypothetical protein HZA93_20540 [Verrucomicrobia bacterium]|nr:hypothetical protein [Verrucomicrobiota bacterium]
MMKTSLRLPFFAATWVAAMMLTLANQASAQTVRTRGTTRGIVSESVRKGTVTAPDGQTAITSVDRKWDDATGTGTVNEAAVTPDGRIATRASNLTRERDGTITERGTMTDFDGRPATFTETTKRTNAGPVTVGQMVDANGQVSTYETKTSRANRNQMKLTTVITRADGTKETRVEVLEPARPVARS